MSLDRLLDWHRLAALRDSGCLDTPAEESFDRITAVAAQELRAPVSLISLVDTHRQFFKSVHGLPAPWSDARDTPLSHSFCQHVVRDDAVLVIEDAAAHPRVRDNLAVRDLGVASYLGVPVRTPDGEPLGALCVADVEPRAWTRQDLAVLDELAAAVTPLLRRSAPEHQDPLTGLPDTGAVQDAVIGAVRRGRESGGIVAVIAIGVDAMDLVNEVHGFATGDALLAEVAARLRPAAGNAVLGRVAGDVFAVVAEFRGDDDALDLAVSLRGALAAPFDVDGEPHQLHARVGVATTDPTVDLDGVDLLDRARASLARARALGALAAGAGTEGLHGRAAACERIRKALCGALSRDELWLAYRPVRRDGELVALEAQLRWNGALGLVSPDAFLPVADQTGDIVPIGEWALRNALEAFATWRAGKAIGEDVDLVLGVTPVQLRLVSLPDAVVAAVEESGVPLERLVFEAHRPQPSVGAAAAATYARLAELGVRVAGPGEAVPGAIREDAVDAGAVARLGAG